MAPVHFWTGTPIITNALTVSCGRNFTAILLENGNVVTFGSNQFGQLGFSPFIIGETATPIFVQPDGNNIVNAKYVSCGSEHTVIILDNGIAVSFGRNHYGQLEDTTYSTYNTLTYVCEPNGSVMNNIYDVSCGAVHTAIILMNNTVATFGSNTYGELGRTIFFPMTSAMPGIINSINDTNIDNCTSISCGSNYTSILLDNSNVITFGKNVDGQLGDGTYTNKSSPVYVKTDVNTNLTDAISVSCGDSHTAILLYNGSVVTCGNNAFDQLINNTIGVSSNLPIYVKSNGELITTAISTTCGEYYTVILLENGTTIAGVITVVDN